MTDQSLNWLIKDKYGGVVPIQEVLDEDLARLSAGEPIAYVIGWVNFLGCHIDLTHRTLIPRPETEYWVEQIQKELAPVLNSKVDQSLRILDLCCGSGCIGISFLKKFPHSQLLVDFTDLAENAVQQTRINLRLNHVDEKRVQLLQGHLFEKCSGQYDVIVSNPPYVDRSGKVGEETRFEPPESLFAQNHGLRLIEDIILNSKKYLKLDGKLILEFGMGQENDVKKFAEVAEFKTINLRKDQFGVVRFAELS